jgi:predicted small lipoprotein YifL
MRLLLGTCFAALCLAGCGQKGPLYLPDQKQKVVVTGAQPPATPTPPPKQPTDADDPSQP